ncbi:MAG: B12-binding domain-containing radical SAM protein, partial [Candidatus Omnitrophota bacterium]
EKNKELPEKIPNFWIRKDGKVFKNPVGPLIRDLDILPFPDTELFLKKFPHLKLWKRQEIIAHRGCPYQCSYCFNHAYNELYKNYSFIYRSRSPENICAEIEYARSLREIKSIYFVDDVFTLDLNWLKKFSPLYRKHIGIPFSCNIRLDNCSEEIVSLLKEANCYLVHVGIETGNEEIRKNILNKNISNETIIKNVKILNKFGIKILTENMLGLPGETYKLSLETLKLNSLIKPDIAIASFFTPYPGLKLTEYAIKNDYFEGEYEKLPVNYHHYSILKFKDKKELNKIENLRCFFSFLSRNSNFLFLLQKFFSFKNNGLFRFLGNLWDGYYLMKGLPYKIKIREFLQFLRIYLTAYRN